VCSSDLLFGSMAAWRFVRDQQSPRTAVSVAHTPTPKNLLFSALFHMGQQTYIVCADASLVLYEDISGSTVPLSGYVSRNFAPPMRGASGAITDLLKLLPQRPYTNIADVRLVQAIVQLNHDYPGQVAVRHARNIQLIDFKKNNLILLGCRHANPWVELFEDSLNFRSVLDPKTQRPGFRNLNPLPNERSFYWLEGNSAQAGKTYSVITFVPNVTHNGSVLMIGGATGEGTEAAGEFAIDPELSEHMLKTIHALDHDRIRNFEVLLRSGTLGGTSGPAEIVAYRLLPVGR
jgi:hypothetical protein